MKVGFKGVKIIKACFRDEISVSIMKPWSLTVINKKKGLLIRTESSKNVQSTLVISNSKGHSEILRDIHTSTYQICRIEEKITQTTTFNKYMCNWTLEVRDIY